MREIVMGLLKLIITLFKVGMGDQGLSNKMTIVALANGMIGGIILLMPIFALKSGTALIAPVSIITGFFSYFSCLLCLRHLRNFKDLDEAIYIHFGKKRSYKLFYDITIVISISVLLILYFDLICKQWEGIIAQSPLIPVLNALVLFPIIYLMKKFHLGAMLLAYGILSIIGYCIFLLWLWITAPQGPKQVVVADSHFTELGAALAQGYAIQAFFVPILKQNPNRNQYKKLLLLTYAIGIGVYTFIGYSGAFSLINRQYPGDKEPETIEGYFKGKQWEVILLQVFYLVHLYSAFPQFLLISKKRFFGIVDWKEQKDVTFKDVLYVGITILVCLIIKLTKVSADVLIELNGSIISFIFVYIIPIGLHVKCVYMTKDHERYVEWEDEKAPKDAEVELDDYQGTQKERKEEEDMGTQKQTQNDLRTGKQKQEGDQSKESNRSKRVVVEGDENSCCDIKFSSKGQEYCEMAIMVLMIGMGLTTLVLTVFFVAEEESGASSDSESKSLL